MKRLVCWMIKWRGVIIYEKAALFREDGVLQFAKSDCLTCLNLLNISDQELSKVFNFLDQKRICDISRCINCRSYIFSGGVSLSRQCVVQSTPKYSSSVKIELTVPNPCLNACKSVDLARYIILISSRNKVK